MNTLELVLTDLLDCGYCDLAELDILYSDLAEDVGIDSQSILKESIQYERGLNGVLFDIMYSISESIGNRLQDLLTEYKDTLQNNKPTTDTENTDLYDLISEYMYNSKDKFIGLSRKQITTLEENITELQNPNIFTNYLDSHYQNVLDQTLDSDVSIDQNIKNIVEYLFKE